MITKKSIISLSAAFACLAGVAMTNTATSAVFCLPFSSGTAPNLPLASTNNVQTWGCSVTNNGGSASGLGRSQVVSGVKQVCSDLMTGTETETRGLDSSGNSISSCRATVNTTAGGFVCDTSGCDTAQKMDVTVEG